MSMDIESLRCFDAAANLLSFRAAARVVGLSPAALGQRIRHLEDDFGIPLFERTTRRVTLTRSGLALQVVARRALEALEECRRVGRGGKSHVPVDVTLGTRHELGLSWLLPMKDALEAAHEALTIHLYFGSGTDVLTQVRSHTLDCAVTSARVVDPKLEWIELHPEHYVFIGAKSLLQTRPLRRAEDCSTHTLFDISDDLPLFRYFRDAPGGLDSRRFAKIVRLGTIDAIHCEVRRGQGVAVLPKYLVRPGLGDRTLRSLMPAVNPLVDAFRLVFRADDTRRSLYETLATVMRKHPLQ